jgi:dihydroorotase|tara:strand:- start:2053 stop:3111 length:1059 start_codon:yes stop_codon:yes gene_type:complete
MLSQIMIKVLKIRKPDDWHLHLRDGDMLKPILKETVRDFKRAIIMPNLVPPILNSKDALNYRDKILSALPEGSKFEPLMTIYLTDKSNHKDIIEAYLSGLISAVKLYPAGATTNSQSGVTNLDNIRPLLEKITEVGVPICIHGETSSPSVDIFDREAFFIEEILDPIRNKIPGIKIILEHITTKEGVEYILSEGKNLAATITTHHLIINRNDLLAGGIKPHYYCLPIAKREKHRIALRAAATSGDKRFFLGTDSAPHVDSLKESNCGCAGIFSATNTMSYLAHVFEEEDALHQLEKFVSINGPTFYNLKVNEEICTLYKHEKPVIFPEKIQIGNENVTLFNPGFSSNWSTQG